MPYGIAESYRGSLSHPHRSRCYGRYSWVRMRVQTNACEVHCSVLQGVAVTRAQCALICAIMYLFTYPFADVLLAGLHPRPNWGSGLTYSARQTP